VTKQISPFFRGDTSVPLLRFTEPNYVGLFGEIMHGPVICALMHILDF